MKLVPVLAALVGLSILACAAPSGDEEAASGGNALSGSVADGRACAIRSTFLAADVDDFELVRKDNVLDAVRYAVGEERDAFTYSVFAVNGLGKIYVAEKPTTSGPHMEFYALNGTFYGNADAQAGSIRFTGPGGAKLSCETGAATSSIDADAGDGG